MTARGAPWCPPVVHALLTSGVLALLVAGTAGAQTPACATVPQSTVGTIVPLYSYPTDASWASLASAKQRRKKIPVTVIVDPANGVGAAIDPNYVTGIQLLRASCIHVLGYVDTAYAARPQAAVEAEIGTWQQFYPDITGVFLDRMSNLPGNESYYGAISTYAHSLGLAETVGNPGTDTPESFLGTVDTLLIYENAGLPDLPSIAGAWYASHAKRNFGIIPYAIAPLSPRRPTSLSATDRAFITAAAPLVGWIYLTDGMLPNPWDTLPPYLKRLLGALNRAGRPPRQ